MANKFTMKLDEGAIQRAAEKTGRTLDEMVQKISERLFENIVRRTPVDTGWARANWIPSIGSPDDSVPESSPGRDENIDDPLPRISLEVASGKAGDIFFLTNSVPYILSLEYGHSAQAPNGMVRVSIEEVRAFYQEALKT